MSRLLTTQTELHFFFLTFAAQDATKTGGQTWRFLLLRGAFLHFSSESSVSSLICIEWPFLNTARSLTKSSPRNAALPPSGAEATVHRLGARLQARTQKRKRNGAVETRSVLQLTTECKRRERQDEMEEEEEEGQDKREREREVGATRAEAPVFSLKPTVFSEEAGCIISAGK